MLAPWTLLAGNKLVWSFIAAIWWLKLRCFLKIAWDIVTWIFIQLVQGHSTYPICDKADMHLILADSWLLLPAALFLTGWQLNCIFCWQGQFSAASKSFAGWQFLPAGSLKSTLVALQFLADRPSSWHINNLAGYNEKSCCVEMYTAICPLMITVKDFVIFVCITFLTLQGQIPIRCMYMTTLDSSIFNG